MSIRIGRVLIAAVAAEILGVAILAALVAVFGPSGFKEAQPFAEKLGQWVGPISGFALCTLGGWWVAKAAPPPHKLVNGLAMGLCGAVLDIAIAAGFGSVWSPLLLLSNGGRILGGTLGGWLARKIATSGT